MGDVVGPPPATWLDESEAGRRPVNGSLRRPPRPPRPDPMRDRPPCDAYGCYSEGQLVECLDDDDGQWYPIRVCWRHLDDASAAEPHAWRNLDGSPIRTVVGATQDALGDLPDDDAYTPSPVDALGAASKPWTPPPASTVFDDWDAPENDPERGLRRRITEQDRALRAAAAEEPPSAAALTERARVASKVRATRAAIGVDRFPRRTALTPSRTPAARRRERARAKARARGEEVPLTLTEQRALKTAARKLGIDPRTLPS